jgi:hypothetical protein
MSAPGEHQVVVVFDVTAPDLIQAGELVRDVLVDLRIVGMADLTDHLQRIDSWWMPEEPLRSQVDRNDNTPMTLVPDEVTR